jgi:hypothetical protein
MNKYYFTSLIIVNVILICTVTYLKLGNHPRNKEIGSEGKVILESMESDAMFGTIPDLKILKFNGDTISLGDICRNDDYVVIFRVPLYACTSCVEKELDIIRKVSTNEKISNFYIISSFPSFREYYVQFKNFSSCPVFFLPSYFDNKLDAFSIPYYLLIDNNRRLISLYYVDDNDSDKIENLLYRINSLSQNNLE